MDVNRSAHAGHVKRCLLGLPSSQIDLDGASMAVVFYCVGSLDLMGLLETRTKEEERAQWREWIWEQYTHGPHGAGFRPSTFMTMTNSDEDCTDYDGPHIIMTYTALLTLAILRDDFSRLDRAELAQFVSSCQLENGCFSTITNGIEFDLRSLYCAFVISHLLDDWSGVDVDRALSFIASCRSYEGGYGQSSLGESLGGTTYTALAAIYLAPPSYPRLSVSERNQTIRWLLNNQHVKGGGFSGRTNKLEDACYCFWCGASLEILGARDLVEDTALRQFLTDCQFRFGGIAKAPGEMPDPYHTYLSLATLSIYREEGSKEEWEPLDALLNAKQSTAKWARQKIPARLG